MTQASKEARTQTSYTCIPWSNLRDDANWFHYPLDCFLVQEQFSDDDAARPITSATSKLVMFCAEGSDLWQRTSYGFQHDNAHAFLGTALRDKRAVEVAFSVDSFHGQFDQGGILVRENDQSWLKAGVEFADGVRHLSAVATRQGFSDWSTGAWPSEWQGKERVVVRVSRQGDALIVRAKLFEDNHISEPFDASKWRLLRVCPVPPTAVLTVGPYSAAPTRNGLFVEFLHYAECEGEALH